MDHRYRNGDDTAIDHHDDFEQSDGSYQTYLPDVPSDLALHRYKHDHFQTTYAKLEDVLNSRRPSVAEGGQSPRRDSHQLPHNSFEPSDQPIPELEVLQTEEPSSEPDDDDALEIQFKRLGMHRPGSSKLSSRSDIDFQGPNPKEIEIAYSSSTFNTAKVTPTDRDGPQVVLGVYPPIPPEPQLQPVLHNSISANEPTELMLETPPIERPSKYHLRARTFPIRQGHTHRSLSETDNLHAVRDRPVVDTHSSSPPRHIAPRFTGFSHPPGSHPLYGAHPSHPPLRLQPHPGRARPLPPMHPRPHFAPNPGPLCLPLPRRDNPSPPVDPDKDTFYHELKSKLWKLAQELELRQPQRVTIPEDADLPTPESPWDDELESPHGGIADGLCSGCSNKALQRETCSSWGDRNGFGRLEMSTPPDTCDDAETEQDGGNTTDNWDGMEKWKTKLRIQRRPSEGRGRRRARERAESVAQKVFGAPD